MLKKFIILEILQIFIIHLIPVQVTAVFVLEYETLKKYCENSLLKNSTKMSIVWPKKIPNKTWLVEPATLAQNAHLNTRLDSESIEGVELS